MARFKLLPIFVFLSTVSISSSVKCFECEQRGESGMCWNPKKGSTQVQDNCDYCNANKAVTPNGEKRVVRKCGHGYMKLFKDACLETMVSGTEETRCTCNSDLCNDAVGYGMTALAIVLFKMLTKL